MQVLNDLQDCMQSTKVSHFECLLPLGIMLQDMLISYDNPSCNVMLLPNSDIVALRNMVTCQEVIGTLRDIFVSCPLVAGQQETP